MDSMPFTTTLTLSGRIKFDGSYVRTMKSLEDMVEWGFECIDDSFPGRIDSAHVDSHLLRDPAPEPVPVPHWNIREWVNA